MRSAEPPGLQRTNVVIRERERIKAPDVRWHSENRGVGSTPRCRLFRLPFRTPEEIPCKLPRRDDWRQHTQVVRPVFRIEQLLDMVNHNKSPYEGNSDATSRWKDL